MANCEITSSVCSSLFLLCQPTHTVELLIHEQRRHKAITTVNSMSRAVIQAHDSVLFRLVNTFNSPSVSTALKQLLPDNTNSLISYLQPTLHPARPGSTAAGQTHSISLHPRITPWCTLGLLEA